MVQPLWKTVWDFLRKLNIAVPYNPAVLFLGIFPREMKICPHRNLHIMLITMFFITTKKEWKDPNCPSTVEWTNKMWYIYTRGNYSTIKRNEILIHATI